MFTRTIAFATALTTAGALSAYADTVGDDLSTKGKSLENAAEVEEGATEVDKDTYATQGHDIVTIGVEENASNDEGIVDDNKTDKRVETGSSTEVENILAAAEAGSEVRTVQGDVIGTVAYKQDQMGDAGHLVFVDIDPSANLQVPTVGIQTKSLQAVQEGEVLEYAFSIEYLRERIQDELNKS